MKLNNFKKQAQKILPSKLKYLYISRENTLN